MERPDINKPVIEPGARMRLAATTQDINEANRISEQYAMQGFQTKIVKRMQANLALYEVWIGKSPDVFSR